MVFISDNGPNPWVSEDYAENRGSEWFAQFDNIGQPMSHYAYSMGFGSACFGPLDLFKMTVGEGRLRTPLLVAGPGIPAGRRTNAFAYVWDLMPTLLDYAAPYGRCEWKLFDVVADPGETQNLASAKLETLKKLQAAW